MQDFPDEFIDARVNFLEGIQAFMLSNMTIVGARAATDLGTARFEEMGRMLGKGAIASIYAAKDNNAVLVSDDLKLRQVARNDWNVSGIGTQALLMFLLRKRMLSEHEYHQHVGTLAIANYHFMLFDASTLVWAIESDPTRIAPAIPALLRSLEGPQCSTESAVQVLADAITAVWLTPGLPERKAMFLDLGLNALAKGRSANDAIRRLGLALRARFALAPLQLAEIVHTIDLWLQTRNLRNT